MKLNTEQRSVLRAALQTANNMGASPRVRKALIEAGLVESNLQNLNHGDRDSLGFLQQRPSQGWKNARDPEKAAGDFLKQAIALNSKGFKGSAGQLAQAVQRSAFPGRYDDRGADAASLLGGKGGKTNTQYLNQVKNDPEAQKRVALANFLAKRNPDSMLLKLGVVNSEEPTTTTSKVKVVGSGTRRNDRSSPTAGLEGASLKDLAKLATKMGLTVREFEPYDKVDPVHADGSYHYSNRAFDASGDPKLMAKFSRVINRNIRPQVKELFYNGPGGRNIKNGKRVQRGFVSGHTDHVHIAE